MSIRLDPKEKISEPELSTGLLNYFFDGIFVQIMGTFSGGAFLVAYALLLGASNLTIGLIAAVGPLSQLFQLPTILLVEKIGNRKILTVIHAFFSRFFWFVVAAIPWIAPKSFHVFLFLFALSMSYVFGTISNLSLISWMRDLIPDSIRGRYIADRMVIMTIISAILSLLAGAGVDVYRQFGAEITIYSAYFILGGMFGLLGVYFLARIPEPVMLRGKTANLSEAIKIPFYDINFRHLLFFLGIWNFAVNLTAPFFTVYMLKRLDLGMTMIITLSVLSQIVNVMFLRIWGRLSDRFSNKSVLLLVCMLFLITMAAWPFTTMPEVYFLTIPLLLAIHVLAGMSSAGIMLCTGNIVLKLAPHRRATAYLAVSALISGSVATFASILGGLAASWLDAERLSLTVRWISVESLRWEVFAIDLSGLDFLFVISGLVGLYAVHRLIAVKETGEVEAEIIFEHFRIEVRRAVANISNIGGLLDLIFFPYARLREIFHPEDEDGDATT